MPFRRVVQVVTKTHVANCEAFRVMTGADRSVVMCQPIQQGVRIVRNEARNPRCGGPGITVDVVDRIASGVLAHGLGARLVGIF